MTEGVLEKQDIKFASNIRIRHKAQGDAIRATLEKGEDKDSYYFVAGDYGESRYLNSRILNSREYSDQGLAREPFDIQELSGFEIFLQKTINKLTLMKKDGDPIVLLDIGAMTGLTWHRLANHYKDQVEKGKIVFVTSNLAYVGIPPAPKSYEDPEVTEDRKKRIFLEKTKNLVQNIYGTPSQLRRRKIKLPDGKEIPLEHHVDLIHESFSVTSWSKVPDIDILRIPALLSEIGTYFVYGINTREMEIQKREDRYFEEREERREGIRMAHEQLVDKYGLTKITHVEEGKLKGKLLNYIVFRGNKSPTITVDE